MPRDNPVQRLVRSVSDARQRHRARHRPTGFGFALADRIGYLDPRAWDAVTCNASVFIGRPYLEALEVAGPSSISGRHALVYRGREPVAAVAAQAVEISASRVAKARPARNAENPDPIRRALSKATASLKSTALDKLEARVLVCGNLLSWGPHGVAFAPGVNAAEVWPGVAEAVYRLRRADKLAGETDLILMKDIPATDTVAEPALRTFSYRPIDTDPDMVLDIPASWRRYEDYLASLSSRYRKSALGIAADFEAAGLRLAPLGDLGPHAGRLHELYLQVHGEARVRPATLEPGFLPELARAMGADFRVTAALQGADIAGFVTTLRDGDTAVGYFIGFDRARNAETPIYFRLLQAVVADAIALGAKRLSLGRTALEPKARLGARPVPLRVFVRHRVPLLNWVVRQLLRAVPHDEPPDRNPFKR